MPRKRPPVIWLFAVLAAWLVVLEALVVLAPDLDAGPVFGDYAHNVIEIAAGLLCLAGAWRAPRERLAWALIGSGVLAWAFGNLYYTVVLYDLEEQPVPSPADIGFLLFPALVLVGALLLARTRSRGLPKTLRTDGAIAALAVSSVSAAIVFEKALSAAEGEPIVVGATFLAYPLSDLVLIGVIVGALAGTGWRLDRTWVPFVIGVFVFWAADSLYLVRTTGGTYHPPTWFDLGWTIGLLLVAFAAWQPADRRRAAVPETLRFIAVPLAFAAVGLVVLVYGAVAGLNPLAVVLSAASLVAVMARLVLTFRENVTMLRVSRIEAMTDALTGLGNRRALAIDLESSLPLADDACPLVLVLFDLDGFKRYNDTFGHPAGDALLNRLGSALATYLKDRGRAYRMGGDEFCALFEPGGDVADPIIAGAASTLSESGEGFEVHCSYGSIVLPREADGATEALRIADQRMYMQKNAGVNSATRQSKDVLLRAIAESDPDLYDTLQRLAALAVLTAERLGLPPDEVEQIRHAAELHDVGKVAIPDAILSKPGPLDVREWEFIRRHTLMGERIISAAPALGAVAALVRSSHERWDGTGYPDRLAAHDIPFGSRIVAVTDAFEAMTADRPYQRAREPEQVLAELRRCAGTQFDPVVVEAFCAAWAHMRSSTAA